MYYKRHGRYVDIACSVCGHVTTTATKPTEGFESQFEKIIPIPRANTAGYCPYCNTKGTYKTSGTVKGPYMLNSKCFVAQPYKETGVVVRYINVDKIYSLDLAWKESVKSWQGRKERISITELTRNVLWKGKKTADRLPQIFSYKRWVLGWLQSGWLLQHKNRTSENIWKKLRDAKRYVPSVLRSERICQL
mgnify:CR=1 FL=1